MLAYHNDEAFKTRVVEKALDYSPNQGSIVAYEAHGITGGINPEPYKITAEYFGFPEWLERYRDFADFGVACYVWHTGIKAAVPVGMTEAQFEDVRMQFETFMLDGLSNNLKVDCPRVKVNSQLEAYEDMGIDDDVLAFQKLELLSNVQMDQVKQIEQTFKDYSPEQEKADKLQLFQIYTRKLIELLQAPQYSEEATG